MGKVPKWGNGRIVDFWELGGKRERDRIVVGAERGRTNLCGFLAARPRGSSLS